MKRVSPCLALAVGLSCQVLAACGEGVLSGGSREDGQERGMAITNGELDSANRFSNVGALLAEWPAGGGIYIPICTGTLVAPRVFLTASHCTAVIDAYALSTAVTFDPVATSSSPRLAGVTHTHPEFGVPGQNDPHDVAVITLERDAGDLFPGIAPARLPEAGQFDKLGSGAGQKKDPFTAVGYGVYSRTVGMGQPVQSFDGARRVAVSSFDALNGAWLRLSQNSATGDGGTCYGDSGGPNFVGAKGTITDVVAGITVTGDTVCRATNVIYRLDTLSARTFLAAYLTLP